MARTISLANHFTSDELKTRYQRSTDPVESRRWHLLWLVSQQRYLIDAAACVGVSYSYARKVVHAYNSDGLSAIANRRRGRIVPSRALLDETGQQELEQALQSPPRDGGLWSGPKVAHWIAQKTGRAHVHPQRGWDYLRRLGYSRQRPRPCHAKADPAAQEAFKKTSLNG
jgi:Transposase and inactivated derivatives